MPPANNLTRDEARQRASLISGLLYDITLDLTQGAETFTCDATVNFLCSQPGASSFVDFLAASVESLELNGEEVPREAIGDSRIQLMNLKDANELHVRAVCNYGNTGAGLSYFKDPIDGRVYLHTQFEHFDAHRVYPCFDQPDLKATFAFTVFAPPDWQVVSNSPGRGRPVEGRSDVARWSFDTTPKVSSYFTAIVAGPFHVVRDKRGSIELGLFCRQSLAQYLEADEMFEVTKQGLDFFSQAYAYPYVLSKYDQLFVPEFSAGAMENLGCITLSEYFLFRSKVTEAAREDRANVILHEMAHMWFGDLVTMRWWDDLWLNESFATFMSVLAQVEATRFKNGWVTFANQIKARARRQDQLPTTHPIAANIPDTESVHLNFDAITYDKGASVLRQLVAWVGQDNFLKGVQRYLKKRQFANASLSEFLSDIEEGSGRNLSAWSEDWLETAGLNTLRPLFSSRPASNGALLAGFAVQQEAPEEFPALRPHRLAIGLYDRGQTLQLRRRVELDVTGAKTPVPQLDGEPLADLILTNDQDLTYAKIRMDQHSIDTARDHLALMRDPLARAVCWSALWDMVRDAELAARQYVPLVLNNIHGEDDIGVVQDLLAQCSAAIDVYGDPANAATATDQFAERAHGWLEQAPAGSDLQLTWAHAFIAAARTQEQLSILRGILDGTVRYEGLKVDFDVRWSIVVALAARGAADGLIDEELKRDPTDAGQRHAATARAAQPTAEAKSQAWALVTEDRSLPLATLRAIMGGFHRYDQRPLLEPYAQIYFATLDPFWKSRTIEVALAFANGMYPRVLIGQRTLRLTDDYLSSDSRPGPIRRILLEGRDTIQRAMRARALDSAQTGVGSVTSR